MKNKSSVKTAKAKKKTSSRKVICIVEGCEREATAHEYCQFHYIRHWSKIKKSERVEAERRLNKYIEEITRKFPTEYLEIIKKDLEDSQALEGVMLDMDLEEGINGGEDLIEEQILQKIKNDED
jgi:hypothetical protein